MRPTIVPATEDHLPAIVSIAERLALGRASPEQQKRVGFLVSGFSEADYRGLLKEADHFRVALVDGATAGFVLACSRDRIGPHESVYMQAGERHPEPFVLVKQIGVRPEVAGTGVGRALYEHIMCSAPGQALIAAVVLDPPNRRSVRFHERLGFRLDFEATPPDGMRRGVYVRPPDSLSAHGPRTGAAPRRTSSRSLTGG